MRLFVCLCLFPLFGFAQLDLTPQPAEYEVEGARFPCVSFRHGTAEISYTPPRGWTTVGDARRVNLRPPGILDAEASMSWVQLKSAEPLSEDAWKTKALSQLPEGATKAQVITLTKDPISVSGRPTIEVVLSYFYQAREVHQTFLFLSVGNLELQFALYAPAAKFPDLRQAFVSSLCSFQGF